MSAVEKARKDMSKQLFTTASVALLRFSPDSEHSEGTRKIFKELPPLAAVDKNAKHAMHYNACVQQRKSFTLLQCAAYWRPTECCS